MRFFLLLIGAAVAACGSNGEPSWVLTSSTSAMGLHGPVFEDLTGTVTDWGYAEDVDSWAEVPDDFRWGIRQSDSQSIDVGWWGLPCDDDPRLVVRAETIELTLDGYLGDRPDPEVGCAAMGIWREFRLTYTDPIDAEELSLEVIEPPD